MSRATSISTRWQFGPGYCLAVASIWAKMVSLLPCLVTIVPTRMPGTPRFHNLPWLFLLLLRPGAVSKLTRFVLLPFCPSPGLLLNHLEPPPP